MPPIESGMRQSIAEFLPRALRKAITSYELYMDRNHGDETVFKTHHDACKVALAHIKLIVDLARWADIDPTLGNEINQEQLMEVIEQGREELDGKT